MKRISKKSKIFLMSTFILLLLGYIVYYLFVPGFKQSKISDYAYIYVDNHKIFKKVYLVKYGDKMLIDLKNDKFSIYIPHHNLMKDMWKVNDFTDKDVKIVKSYIKKNRVPIYDWNKDGGHYDMQVFEFKTEKGVSGKLVFYYEEDTDSNVHNENLNEKRKKEITLIIGHENN
ncbi:hypothetical protein [Clostridium amazonitimonense]|uniref:hypothetical protein n=1 Tax=Clostridium amazonitimonense TaxID=1499689 RepID=UPI00050999EC|nr:hypothetical protein [Clostridium amazonitimonense]